MLVCLTLIIKMFLLKIRVCSLAFQKVQGWLLRAVNVQEHEKRILIVSFLYFFSLLCGYYMLRPIREEMGIQGGVENLHWLFTATFVSMLLIVPLFGWITARFRRRKFIPIAYGFIIANLLIFFVLFKSGINYVWIARAFFVWASVINLFIVSVFWSFMTDIFSDEQAMRVFPFIAAGGTTGAIAGPAITGLLVRQIGAANLLPISAVFLVIAIICMLNIIKMIDQQQKNQTTPTNKKIIGGSIFDGIRLVLTSKYLLGICAVIFLYATTSTFLYFQQANIISTYIQDSATRTSLFAGMDVTANVLTLFFQLFLTGRIIQRFGLAITLMIIPVMVTIAFLALSFSPIVITIVIIQVIRRAGNYALMRPARETLYVVLSRAEKYKAKNFIDTAVYRSGDVISAWVYAAASSMGMTLSGIALLGALISAVWVYIAHWLGQKHDQYPL